MAVENCEVCGGTFEEGTLTHEHYKIDASMDLAWVLASILIMISVFCTAKVGIELEDISILPWACAGWSGVLMLAIRIKLLQKRKRALQRKINMRVIALN